MAKKLVWLNIETGEFSNSWTNGEYDTDKEELLNNTDSNSRWKLIEFECLTDEDFEFSHFMRIR